MPDLQPFQMPAVRPTGRRLPESLSAQISDAGGRRLPDDGEELQLPDGINVEEARYVAISFLLATFEALGF